MTTADEIKLEILESSYWEHYKMQKDLAMFLPLKHPKRVALEEATAELLKKINAVRDNDKLPTDNPGRSSGLPAEPNNSTPREQGVLAKV